MSKTITKNRDRNGVRVRVTEYADGGRYVEADCRCYGIPGRTHSTSCCPLYLEIQAQAASFVATQLVLERKA